jgi:hypothetical protein
MVMRPIPSRVRLSAARPCSRPASSALNSQQRRHQLLAVETARPAAPPPGGRPKPKAGARRALERRKALWRPTVSGRMINRYSLMRRAGCCASCGAARRPPRPGCPHPRATDSRPLLAGILSVRRRALGFQTDSTVTCECDSLTNDQSLRSANGAGALSLSRGTTLALDSPRGLESRR